jgi:CRP-like cAMP-binding protein|tara:strand:+ start:4775 stop:5842 length:1068 start_codon:yes stop_codon:yes gene_type:complete
MAAVTADQLKALHPFTEFESPQIINDVLSRGVLRKCKEGTILFKREQVDDTINWLMSGSLDLLDEDFDVVALQSTDDAARKALDDQSPHSVTAVTTSDCVVFRLKRSFLDLVKKLAASDNVMVTSMEETEESDSDWMSAMLTSHLFDFLEPANIQALFSHFEEVEYAAGDTVITQGEAGDYFYVMKSGRAKVEYNTSSKAILLAELETGAFFGEDALISDVPRNATITMLTNGKLERLAEGDFEKLMHSPTVVKLKLEEVEKMIEEGDPLTWILDVRTRHEFQDNMIEDSINIPILKIREGLSKLDEEAVYVLRSQGDKRAELAAFILLENGFDAYVLAEKRPPTEKTGDDSADE